MGYSNVSTRTNSREKYSLLANVLGERQKVWKELLKDHGQKKKKMSKMVCRIIKHTLVTGKNNVSIDHSATYLLYLRTCMPK